MILIIPGVRRSSKTQFQHYNSTSDNKYSERLLLFFRGIVRSNIPDALIIGRIFNYAFILVFRLLQFGDAPAGGFIPDTDIESTRILPGKHPTILLLYLNIP